MIRELATDGDFRSDTGWHDSAPVPCAMSRPTVQCSRPMGWAGYDASRSRFFWGLCLHLVRTPAGMPIPWGLADPKTGEREVLAAMVSPRRRSRGASPNWAFGQDLSG